MPFAGVVGPEGDVDGDAVGPDDGARVGPDDGTCVGPTVGATEGDMLAVGKVGAMDGAVVGDALGITVGADVTPLQPTPPPAQLQVPKVVVSVQRFWLAQ